jgi:hypothetical protein
MGALEKLLFPDLTNNPSANLLGIDAVKRARGRGLLDAGLNMVALSGPRPATENINPAMIMQAGVKSGMNTYDNAIDRATQQLQTTTALQNTINAKETFKNLIESDFLNAEEKAFALSLGHVEGSKFIADLYMQKQKNLNAKPSVKKMEVANDDGTGSGTYEYVSVKDILDPANKDKYLVPDSKGTYAKNISDFENIMGRKLTLEEKQKYIMAVMNGNEKKISVSTDKNGNTTFTIGGSGSDNMEKKSKGTIEQNILNSSYNYETFKEIKKLYRPEFSQIDTKLAVKWAKWKEAGGEWTEALGLEVSDEEKQLIEDYSKWEQKSWEATNQYIKSITGAQMSEAEAERILKGFADPRKFSPTEYQSKLNGILDSARKSTIRYNLILRSGIEIPLDANGNPAPERILSLGSVDKYVNDIGKELKEQLLNDDAYNGFTDKEINDEVKKQLKVLMFGDTTQNAFTLKDLTDG